MATTKLDEQQLPVISGGSTTGYFIPDYGATEPTNLITTNHGTWTADRVGFVNAYVVATENVSAICKINGKVVGQAYNAGPSALMRNVFAVKPGDVVELYADTTDHSGIGCVFIPPVYVPTNLSGLINYPNQWPANTEVDLGNGMYGKRITGTITAAADVRAVVSIQTGVSNIISYGGTWGTAESNYSWSPVGSTLTQGSGTTPQGFVSEIRLDSVNIMDFRSVSNQSRSGGANTRYDVWVKYTKS